MNTRVKIAIAAVIIAALVVLIVLDRSTTAPKEEDRKEARKKGSIFKKPEKRKESPFRKENRLDREIEFGAKKVGETLKEEIKNIVPEFVDKTNIKGPDEAGPEKKIKGQEQKPIQVPVPKKDDLYVIQSGDSFYKIAEKKYGDGNLWKVIADANPQVKPYSLRVGRRIVVPGRPAPVAGGGGGGDIVNEDGRRLYVVRPGDTLTGISHKKFGTIKYADDIFELNNGLLATMDSLVVGQKLVLPDVNASPVSRDAVSIPPGAKAHKVAGGESLWKIAEKYAGERNIMTMIQLIVDANPTRLKSSTTTLRKGWTLIIPN